MLYFLVFLSGVYAGIASAGQDTLCGPVENIKEYRLNVAGGQFHLPSFMELRFENNALWRDKDVRRWDLNRDSVQSFQFQTHLFILAWESDCADGSSPRLFHIGKTKNEIREYSMMSMNESDFEAGFFVSGGQLHYWEKAFCSTSARPQDFGHRQFDYVFRPDSLEFKLNQYKSLPAEACLPANVEQDRIKNKIKLTALKIVK